MVPTVGGVLLFGVDRLAHFPDAWVQAGRFTGPTDQPSATMRTSRCRWSTRLKQRSRSWRSMRCAAPTSAQCAGRTAGTCRRQRSAKRSSTRSPTRTTRNGARRSESRSSTIGSRWKPGLLPFGITLDDLPLGISKLRNWTLGRVFHELGLVEQWGSGIQRMIAACRDSGLSAPVWEEIGVRLRVTIRTDGTGAANLDPTDRSILDLLEQGDGRTTSEVATAIGLSPRATRTRLAKLVSRGLVREVGTGPRDPKRRYVAGLSNHG